MKTATDAQKLTALTQLVSATEQLVSRGGNSKTWRLITTFKAKKVLRLVFGRAAKNDEIKRLVDTIKAKPVKAAVNGKATRPVAKRPLKTVVKRGTKPTVAKAPKAPKAAKPARKAAVAPAAPASVATPATPATATTA